MLYNSIVDFLQPYWSNCFRWSTIMGANEVNAVSFIGLKLYFRARLLLQCLTVDAVDELCQLATEQLSHLSFSCFRLEYVPFRRIVYFHFQWFAAFFNTHKICLNAILDLFSFSLFYEKFSGEIFQYCQAGYLNFTKISQECSLKIRGTKYSR